MPDQKANIPTEITTCHSKQNACLCKQKRTGSGTWRFQKTDTSSAERSNLHLSINKRMSLRTLFLTCSSSNDANQGMNIFIKFNVIFTLKFMDWALVVVRLHIIKCAWREKWISTCLVCETN